jgi:HAD superfamily hydrolase (TIGR01509 family)
VRVAAVILDMDGLMIDTETPVQQCCQAAATEMGFDLDDEFYAGTLVGRGWDDCHVALTARFGPRFSIAEFQERFQEKWNRRLHAGIAVKPGLHDLLTLLRDRQVPVGVATSTHGAEAKASLAAAGVSQTFDAFVTGDQVTRGKPDPEIYLIAASRLGLQPESCVALEDSSPGALAASGAGMRTLLIPDAGRPPTREAAQVVFQVLPSLHEAARLLADWLR